MKRRHFKRLTARGLASVFWSDWAGAALVAGLLVYWLQ